MGKSHKYINSHIHILIRKTLVLSLLIILCCVDYQSTSLFPLLTHYQYYSLPTTVQRPPSFPTPPCSCQNPYTMGKTPWNYQPWMSTSSARRSTPLSRKCQRLLQGVPGFYHYTLPIRQWTTQARTRRSCRRSFQKPGRHSTTTRNISDIHTKPLAEAAFKCHRPHLCIIDPRAHPRRTIIHNNAPDDNSDATATQEQSPC